MSPKDRAYEHGRLKAQTGAKLPTFTPYRSDTLARAFRQGFIDQKTTEPVDYAMPTKAKQP